MSPILEEAPVLAPARVEPSAPSELVWAAMVLGSERLQPTPVHDVRETRRDLVERVRGFWPGASGCFTELFVLADRAGALWSDDVAPLLDGMEDAVRSDADPGLASETPEERTAVRTRIAALRDDGLRADYVALLRDVWSAVEGGWAAEGRARVAAACADWRRRLDGGGDLHALLPEAHIALRDAYRPLLDRAVARGVAVVTPLYLAGVGKHIVELPGATLVGIGLDPGAQRGVEAQRARAERLVGRLKALADPTRVLILSELAGAEHSVTDLAVLLRVSQPTVSVHVRVLREAGLLDGRREGGRTLYRTTGDRLDDLLDEVRQHLRGLCAAG